jgi:hypothetical protein
LHLDDLQDKAVRLVHSTELGVVSSDGAKMNSSKVLQRIAESRE